MRFVAVVSRIAAAVCSAAVRAAAACKIAASFLNIDSSCLPGSLRRAYPPQAVVVDRPPNRLFPWPTMLHELAPVVCDDHPTIQTPSARGGFSSSGKPTYRK
jgi:hypothetical protein